MAKRAKPADVIDVEPAGGLEVRETTEAAKSILGFLNGLGAFFGVAKQLESEAAQALADAKTWREPTSLEEDQRLVAAIRLRREHKGKIETHWGIAQAIHRLHKTVTARRAVGVGHDDAAIEIGTTLHNRWAEADRRRVAAEQEAARKAAEAEAQAERDREAAELERAALEAEAGSPELSARAHCFVQLFAGQGVAPADAARMAGFKNPDATAIRLLKLAKIATAIGAAHAALAARRQADAVKAAPLNVKPIEPVKAATAAGGVVYRSAEVVDAVAFINAVIAGGHGIPVDVLQVNQVQLNAYARSLRDQLNRWPGVRYIEDKGVR